MAKTTKGTTNVLEKGITVTFDTKDNGTEIGLNTLCEKVAKGVKNNKVMDITSLIKLKLENHVFSIMSTDGTTNVEVKKTKVPGDAKFEILVKADPFIKLVAKTTASKITLTIIEGKGDNSNTSLQVKGNGTYHFETIELPEGDSFPSFDFEDKNPLTIKRSILNKAIKSNRPATSGDSTNQLVLTGIYFSDKVISSDTEKATATDANIFKKDVLLRPEAIDLLSILVGEDLEVSFKDDRLIITDGLNTVYTAEMQNKEDYPLEVLRSFICEGEFPNTCFINRDELLGCLDRLSVFSDVYSSNGVDLTFDNNDVTVTNSKSQNASEKINYGTGSKNCKPFSCSIAADMLRVQLQIASDVVALSYGNDTALKLRSITPEKDKAGNITSYTIEDDVILVVAFLEEEQA